MPFPPSFDAADDEERLPLGFEAGLAEVCPGDGRLLPSVLFADGGKSAAPLAAELIMSYNRPPKTLTSLMPFVRGGKGNVRLNFIVIVQSTSTDNEMQLSSYKCSPIHIQYIYK